MDLVTANKACMLYMGFFGLTLLASPATFYGASVRLQASSLLEFSPPLHPPSR